MIVVVKIGTSSITDDDGVIDRAAVAKLCGEVAAVAAGGDQVVVVSSGAIAAGLPALGLTARNRPKDARTLQAVSAVGQARLMQVYNEVLADLGSGDGLVAGQVLLAPLDFMIRQQYLHARSTLARLLELGVVPIVNENDAVADDEIRFGDNDRIAALVAQLVGAELLVLLTDASGLYTADPRLDASASLIEEIVEVDREFELMAGGSSSNRGSGGMATKVAAAKIASWSGVRTVIAAADRVGVLSSAISDESVGTTVLPRRHHLPARKLWIAFGVGSSGRVHVDAGAEEALTTGKKSLLGVGVTKVEGRFNATDAVEIIGPGGHPFAKGLVRHGADRLGEQSRRTAGVVIPRDDLVVLP